MKQTLKKILRKMGFDLKRIPRTYPKSVGYPIGDIELFLHGIKERGFTPKGIIDVGANKGHWAVLAAEVFPNAKVIMIEPQDEMRAPLEILCLRDKRFSYVQAGAAKECGELVQTIWPDLAGSSFLPQVDQDALKKGTQRITPVTTIDKILQNNPDFIPDMIKLDIQGFELEALRGASSAFGQTELFVMETNLFEFSPSMPLTSECIQFMKDRGYELYDITGYLRRPFDGALGQVDLAFAKIGGVLRTSNKWAKE